MGKHVKGILDRLQPEPSCSREPRSHTAFELAVDWDGGSVLPTVARDAWVKVNPNDWFGTDTVRKFFPTGRVEANCKPAKWKEGCCG